MERGVRRRSHPLFLSSGREKGGRQANIPLRSAPPGGRIAPSNLIPALGNLMTATSPTSSPWRANMRRAALARTLFLLLALAFPLAYAGDAQAKDCGGAIPCQCGDRVVESVTLPQSLNNCQGNGLIVAAGVLDCAGRQIAGPGARTATVGVLVRGFTGAGAQGAEVRNCRVRNFGKGIEIDSGRANVLDNNVLFDNEIGVWLGDGARDSVITRNHARDNRDEGIHLGEGTQDNELGWNTIVKNRRENLYLIGSSGNWVHDNTIVDSDASAILLKHSSDNVFADNQISDRSIFVRGDSHGNVFENNLVESAYFRFAALEEHGAWTYPHTNQVSGGRILKASTCFEFDGAYGTTVTGVEIDTCRPYEEKEVGDLIPYDNSVSVIRIDVGDPHYHGRRRSGSLRLAPVALDRYRVDIRGLDPATEMDPANEELHCTLTAFEGVLFDFVLPAGSLRPKRRGVSFSDPAGSYDGLRRLDLRQTPNGTWRLSFAGQKALPEVQFPIMTLSCVVGDDTFTFTDYWSERARGWNLRYQP